MCGDPVLEVDSLHCQAASPVKTCNGTGTTGPRCDQCYVVSLTDAYHVSRRLQAQPGRVPDLHKQIKSNFLEEMTYGQWQTAGMLQFDNLGKEVKPLPKMKWHTGTVDLEIRSGPVLVKMTVARNIPGSSYTVLFCFGENAFNHVFLSTYFTESLACIDDGPVSSAAAQISWRRQSRPGYSSAWGKPREWQHEGPHLRRKLYLMF